jgi:selenocysteine lyase/cysteine desulfurase
MIDQHPILKKYTYLNTANHGLVSQDLVNYRNSLNEKLRDEASIFTNNRYIFIDEVRRTVANFMDADPDGTAVTPNFSTGFNILINAVDQQSSFLLLEKDYPSLNGPIETRGFKKWYVAIDDQMEENIRVVCEKESPNFFCFSMVQYISGIQMDLGFLKDLKSRFPSMIIIADATQYIGVEEFSFRKSGVDILIASCYKWLHAGDGNGFICIKKEVKEQVFHQTLSLISPCNLKNADKSFISIFEPGHQDMIAFGSLQQSILKIQEMGWKKVADPVKQLSKIAKSAFEKRNLLTSVVCSRKNHSSIFNIKGDQVLYDKLVKNKILTSLRGDGIRVSFSYFNTEDDLNKLLEVLDL